jgi:hypothetical protein
MIRNTPSAVTAASHDIIPHVLFSLGFMIAKAAALLLSEH